MRIAASDKPAELGRQDLVLVTVKAPALPEVAATMAPLLGPDTAAGFVMNGIPWWYFHAHGGPLDGRQLSLLDPDGALWRTVGPERAIGAVFWPACSVPRPGVIRLLTGAGSGTVFGEPSNLTTPRLQALRRGVSRGRIAGHPDRGHSRADLAQARLQPERRPNVCADRDAGPGYPHRSGPDPPAPARCWPRRWQWLPPWVSNST